MANDDPHRPRSLTVLVIVGICIRTGETGIVASGEAKYSKPANNETGKARRRLLFGLFCITQKCEVSSQMKNPNWFFGGWEMLGLAKINEIKTPAGFLCFFILSLVSSVSPIPAQEAPAAEVLALLDRAVFEVVVPRLENLDTFTYAEELPWNLIPFARRNDPYRSIGTSFCVGDNLFLSSAHVFDLEGESLNEEFFLRDSRGEVYPVETVHGYSNHHDFILLSVRGLKESRERRPIALEPLYDAELNVKVYSVGNAYGEGVILRDGLLTSTTPEERDGAWRWLRFSAAASPGNSGGPLVDRSGRVLGIVNARSENENFNAALPLSVVRDFPKNTARLNRRLVFRLPLFEYLSMDTESYEIVLPKTLGELKRALVAYEDDFAKRLLETLLTENRHRLFPNAKGSDYLLRTPYASFMPGFAAEQSDYTWKMECPEKTYKALLEDKGNLEWGGLKGLDIQRYSRPKDTPLEAIYKDAEAAMDGMLTGYPMTRSVAGTRVRITSLGAPASEGRFEDGHGRVWLMTSWNVSFADQVLLWFRLPTPEGFVGIMKIVPMRARSDIERDISAMATFLDVDYTGTMAQWKEFLSLRDYIPKPLKRLTLKMGAASSYISIADRFTLHLDPEVFCLSPDTSFSCFFSFITDGTETVRWDVDRFILKNSAPEGVSFAIVRVANPGSNLGQDRSSEWISIAAGTEVYDGEPHTYEDKSYTNAVYKFAREMSKDRSSEGNAFAYTGHLIHDSVVPAERARSRMRSLLNGFDVTEEETAKAINLGTDRFLPRRALKTIDNSTIFDALKTADTALLARFLAESQDLDTQDGFGRTPLIVALEMKDPELVLPILDRNVDVNVADSSGRTALMLALKYFDGEIPRRILNKGANYRVLDKSAADCLMYALQYGDEDVASRLLELGIDFRRVNKSGWTSLMYALRYGAPAVAGRLIEMGADVNTSDAYGWTPLTLALKYGQSQNVRPLLFKKAAVDTVDSSSWTPLMYAAYYQKEHVPYLIILGADVEATNDEGRTALHLAVERADSDTIHHFLIHGADPDVPDYDGRTPLDEARSLKNETMVLMLESHSKRDSGD